MPEIGIVETPVIDRSQGPSGTIFVVAMSKDGSGNYHQRLHALNVTTGAEIAGSPTEITATYPGREQIRRTEVSYSIPANTRSERPCFW